MAENRYDNAIFDADGTLFDSYPGVIACVKYAYEYMGTPVPDEAVLRTFLGPSLNNSFRAHTDWTEEEIDRAVTAYRKLYAGGKYREVDFYPGIPALLTRLAAAGVRLTIASSKPLEVLKKVLAYKGLAETFEVVSAPDFSHKSSDKRDLIARAAVGSRPVMIGDRRYDIEGAAAAGVDSIGAAYGYGGRDELTKSGATFIADTPGQIYTIITGETI